MNEHLFKHLNYALSTDPGVDVKKHHDDPNSIVVLKSHDPGGGILPLRKTLQLVGKEYDEVEPASFPTFYTYEAYEVTDLEDLYGMLADTITEADEYVIRGAVLETSGDTIKRRSGVNAEGRSIVDAPRYWCMIDIDDLIPGYAGIPDNWLDLPEAEVHEVLRQLVRTYLPVEFHDVGVIANWSSKMSPFGGKPKVHLFFWFERPVWSIEVRSWLNDRYPIDPAILHPNQPHFTACPLVLDGARNEIADPLGDRRLVYIPGPPAGVPERIEKYVRGATSSENYVPTGNADIDALMSSSMEAKTSSWANMHWKEHVDQIAEPNLHEQFNKAQILYIDQTFPNDDIEELRSYMLNTVTEFDKDRTDANIHDHFYRDFDRAYRTWRASKLPDLRARENAKALEPRELAPNTTMADWTAKLTAKARAIKKVEA